MPHLVWEVAFTSVTWQFLAFSLVKRHGESLSQMPLFREVALWIPARGWSLYPNTCTTEHVRGRHGKCYRNCRYLCKIFYYSAKFVAIYILFYNLHCLNLCIFSRKIWFCCNLSTSFHNFFGIYVFCCPKAYLCKVFDIFHVWIYVAHFKYIDLCDWHWKC